MAMCNAGECGAVAVEGKSVCAVHGAGYRKHDGSRNLLCGTCQKTIAKGEWCRSDSVGQGRLVHAKPCQPAAVRR